MCLRNFSPVVPTGHVLSRHSAEPWLHLQRGSPVPTGLVYLETRMWQATTEVTQELCTPTFPGTCGAQLAIGELTATSSAARLPLQNKQPYSRAHKHSEGPFGGRTFLPPQTGACTERHHSKWMFSPCNGHLQTHPDEPRCPTRACTSNSQQNQTTRRPALLIQRSAVWIKTEKVFWPVPTLPCLKSSVRISQDTLLLFHGWTD